MWGEWGEGRFAAKENLILKWKLRLHLAIYIFISADQTSNISATGIYFIFIFIVSSFLTGNISPSVNCHQGVWYAVLVSTELHLLLIQTYKRRARPVKASFQDSRGEERNEFCLFTILVVVTPPLVKVNITDQTQPGWRWREKSKIQIPTHVRHLHHRPVLRYSQPLPLPLHVSGGVPDVCGAPCDVALL